MKRKFINILLSALILFSNSGWAISFHYCQDSLSSVSLEYIISSVSEEDDDSCASMGSCCASEDDEDENETDEAVLQQDFELEQIQSAMQELDTPSSKPNTSHSSSHPP